jgi:DNA-binding HxlR family transcriptional regulator
MGRFEQPGRSQMAIGQAYTDGEMNPYIGDMHPYEYLMRCISGKWKIYILRGLYLQGPVRFNKGKKTLGICEKVLSRQLKELANDGLLVRTVYPEIPPRVEYTLTQVGESLIPPLASLYEWGRDQMLRKEIPIDPIAEMCHGYGEMKDFEKAPIFKVMNPYEYVFRHVFGKWKIYLLLGLYLKGASRFNEIRKILGVSEKVLSEQLKEMGKSGLIARTDFEENPPHVEYSLTPTGESFIPILILLYVWARDRMRAKDCKVDSRAAKALDDINEKFYGFGKSG